MTGDQPPFRLDPPDVLVQNVGRATLREAMRHARKYGGLEDGEQAFMYTTTESFVFEAGGYRHRFDAGASWYGCVSVDASLMLSFWNALPKGKDLEIRYERGWLSLGSLSIGAARWQPKYDPDWMAE